MKKKKVWVFAVIIVLLVAGGIAYQAMASSRSQASSEVQTTPVSRGTIEVAISGSGTVRSNQSAQVNWRTSGTVGAVSAQVGQQVQAGDELAAIDATTLSSDIIAAQSELIDAQTALEDLQEPQALAIAQAQTNLTDAQETLELLQNPSETAVAQAQLAVLDAQEAVEKAQGYVDGLKYDRASQENLTDAKATYLVAQAEVTRREKAYKALKGDPTKNAAKANALTALEAARTMAQRALDNLNWMQSDWTQDEINEKTTNLTLARGQLADAQEALRRLTDPTEEDIALAEATVADAQDKLETLQAGPTESDLIVAQTRVTQAKAELAQASLSAPFPGTITNVEVMAGDIVTAGTVAFQIDDLSRLFVDLQVSEIDIPQVKAGQAAVLTFDAIADQEYQGVVTKIGMVGSVSQGVVNYPVTVEITDGDDGRTSSPQILPSMTAAVSIIVAQREDVLVVPNQVVRTTGNQRTVTVLFEGQQIQVPVTVGLIGDTLTEITGDSLREGDAVVINTSTSNTAASQNRNQIQGGNFGGPGGPGEFFGP